MKARAFLRKEITKGIDDIDIEDLKLFCYHLFKSGNIDDVLLIWEAKESCFDAHCSIDIQFLCRKNNKTKYIVAPEYKTIWSSDGKEFDQESKSWDGAPKTHWDVFASLGDAKARLETLLKSELDMSKERLDKAKEEIKALEQIKIENLPQDSYISPFTNQKT